MISARTLSFNALKTFFLVVFVFMILSLDIGLGETAGV